MKTKIMIVITLLAMALSYWMVETIIDQQNMHKDSPDIPDSFVHNAVYIRTNNNGAVIDKLTALTVYHFGRDNTSKLITPILVIYNPDKPPWVITAKLAIATQGTDKVVLKHNVKITQKNPDGDTIFTTDELTVWPDRKYAETLRPVTIVQPWSKMHSQGLTANFNTGNVHLLAKARGQYKPANHAKHDSHRLKTR